MVRKLEQLIVQNWLGLTVGFVLTRKAVEYAYMERGSIAFGSEWLVLPVTLVVGNCIRKAWERNVSRKEKRRRYRRKYQRV